MKKYGGGGAMYIVIDRIITELLILILNKYLRKFQEKKNV